MEMPFSTPIYLDCCASTPVEPVVAETLYRVMTQEHGNAGSRTHAYGTRAKSIVEDSRKQLAIATESRPEDVIFTSGATESNNLAILGLTASLEPSRYHVITTSIEHKAVLEPFDFLESRGFSVTRVAVSPLGMVDPEEIRRALRPETILVSVMQANNETGMLQPLAAIGEALNGHETYFHTDAAQAIAWDDGALTRRLDMISASGHKMFAPQGIGALVLRRRGYERPPIAPILYGGGQERGLRPGTLSVPLIAALGKAMALARSNRELRVKKCAQTKERALRALGRIDPILTGSLEFGLSHVLNLRFAGVDSEALMVSFKAVIACSNGSACTSTSYQPSHVLKAMGFSNEEAAGCVRLSWCHLTPEVDWDEVTKCVERLR
jgi:cysteine desulfurase